MAAAQLTPGAVAAMCEHADGGGSLKPVLQVLDLRRVTNSQSAERFRMVLSDGVHTLQSMLATAENHRIRDGAIIKGTIIHLQEYTCSTIQSRRKGGGYLLGLPKTHRLLLLSKIYLDWDSVVDSGIQYTWLSICSIVMLLQQPSIGLVVEHKLLDFS